MKARERILVASVALLVPTAAFGFYCFDLVRNERMALAVAFSRNIQEVQRALVREDEEGIQLAKELAVREQELLALGGQITEIAGTVGTLEKLSKTDPELLQKYSKVFFLNEHYVPGGLELIDASYILSKDKPEQIHVSVAPFLAKLLAEAAAAGVELRIDSAYRSFGEQSALKSTYKVTYGIGANKFSADQGYSEHQLGTTVDITTPAIGTTLSGFEKSNGYAWLTENAHRFGFVLSYPKNNAYYIFEPWHWRFVGVKLATKLHSEGKYFYDMDQRDIDEYLVNLFDAL